MRTSQRLVERRDKGLVRSVGSLGLRPSRGSRASRGARGGARVTPSAVSALLSRSPGSPERGPVLSNDLMQVLVAQMSAMRKEMATIDERIERRLSAAAQQGSSSNNQAIAGPPPQTTPVLQEPPPTSARSNHVGEALLPAAGSQTETSVGQLEATQRAAVTETSLGEYTSTQHDSAREVWGAGSNGGTPPPSYTATMNPPAPLRHSGEVQNSAQEPAPSTSVGQSAARAEKRDTLSFKLGLITPYYAPLGWHLAPAVKEKIRNGEYVDMFSLMLREPEPEPKSGECPAATKTTKKNKVERNWENWFSGFVSYFGVLV